MIDFETEYNNRVIKISDNWCDKNTIGKIHGIMSRLSLTERDIVDWEILVGDEIYPTDEDKKMANEYGDKYSERDRYVTMTVTEEDGSESIMTWEETLEMEIRDGGCYIELYILFIRR